MTDAPSAAQAPTATVRDHSADHAAKHTADHSADHTADRAQPARSASQALATHLAAQAGSFLRGLPAVDLTTLRRVSATLHTFDALLDPGWARELREELGRLTGILGQERAHDRRLARLLASLDSLTCTGATSATAAAATAPATGTPAPTAAALTAEQTGTDRGGESATVPRPRAAEGLLAGHPGAPKARALLERQLTLARSRAHTTALQELGSARFHALADRMTLLISDLPLRDPGDTAPAEALLPYAAEAARSLASAVAELPLQRAAAPYNGDALHDPGDDLPWRRIRVLVQHTQYALEVCAGQLGPRTSQSATGALADLARVLGRHRDAADAAEAAALAARTPRITPATAYVLGVVHADQRLEVEAARHAFSSNWPDLYRSGWLTDPWLTR
ncbi:CHAD domain-containing protein [Streptacidiphilus sp. EB129]|uniref:CHAD domain-containing protein n=1 Tax=Streptacidiphilus sp. EB129 TaxID=3156262 RepID=UPI0035173027